MAALLPALRDAPWLTRARTLAWLRVAMVVQAAILVYFVLRSHGVIGPPLPPFSTDFVSFYAAGQMTAAGHPELVYDQAAHGAAEHAAVHEDKTQYFAFFYPPVYLLLCRLLAPLPYFSAFGLWIAVTMALYLVALRPLLPSRFFPVAALASPAVFFAVASGQNSFLSAALVAAATVAIDRRPFFAGMLFGGLCYKPNLALLVPVALVAGGRWRAVAGAAVMLALAIGASLLFFGVAPWNAYLVQVGSIAQGFARGIVAFELLASPFAALRLLGFGAGPAQIAQTAITLAVMLGVALVWTRRDVPAAARGMVLAIGAVLATPVVLNYDLVLAGIGMAWLARDAAATGFRPFEKITLLGAYAGMPLSMASGRLLHVSFMPWLMLALFGLAFARAWRGEGRAAEAAS